MKRIEKEIKQDSARRIEESLPSIPSLDNLPETSQKQRKTPLFLISIGAAVLIAAIVTPIAVTLSSRSSYQYIESEELSSIYKEYTSQTSHAERPLLTINFALRNNFEMALVQYDFDVSKCNEKIAVTLSKRGVDALTFLEKEDKWRTIESDIINMYGGCIISYDVFSDLKFVHFDPNEKVPVEIDGRYVIALYYVGESFLVEEITNNIEGGKKKKEYYSISAKEGDEGYLVEDIPEPYSRKSFYASKNVVDNDGYFNLGKVGERYARVGEVKNNTLIAESFFFEGMTDVFGKIKPLVNDNSIDYNAFKAALPEYIEYYRNDAYSEGKEISFSQHTYEHDVANYPKVAQLFFSYEDWESVDDQGYVEMIEEHVGNIEEEYFDEHALVFVIGPSQDNNAYYDLNIDSIAIRWGSLQVSATMTPVVGKYGGCFTLAEIDQNDIALLEDNYVSLTLHTNG